MATITQEIRFDLGKNELVKLSDARDEVLNCTGGELWVTIDGDRRDIILTPGERWRIETPAPVVIMALKASTLTVAHRQASRPRLANVRDHLVALLRWRCPPLAAFPSPLIR